MDLQLIAISQTGPFFLGWVGLVEKGGIGRVGGEEEKRRRKRRMR